MEPQNKSGKVSKQRIVKFIQQCDKSDIVLDLQKLNGNLNLTKFDVFRDAVNDLLTEYHAVVQERRQGKFLYITFAIIVRDLINRVKE